MVGASGGEGDSKLRRPSAVSSAILTYGTNLTNAVLSLISVLIVARVLGPEGRGSVAFLTAIAWFTSNLATMGVQEANANLAGSEPQSRRALATNSIGFALLFGAGAAVSLTVLIAVFPAVGGDSTSELRWLTFLSLPVLILAVYLRFLMQADYAFRITNAAWTITPLANVTVNGLLAALGLLSVGTAVATWVVGQTLATIVLVWYVARRLAGFGAPDLALARRTLSFGLKSHGGRILLLGNYRLDQWLVGAIAGPTQLGLYSVAVAWAESLWYLPTTLASVQRPDLVRARPADAASQSALGFRSAVIVTSVLAAIMVVAAPFLCTTIFGSDFEGSVVMLRVLLIGVFGIIALKLFGNALTAQRRPLLASTAISVGFATTVVLDVMLIPPYGGLGAALASALAYTVGGFAIAIIFVRALRGHPGDLVPRGSDVVWLWRRVRSSLSRADQASDTAATLPEEGKP